MFKKVKFKRAIKGICEKAYGLHGHGLWEAGCHTDGGPFVVCGAAGLRP
jgi:hypothetical protein